MISRSSWTLPVLVLTVGLIAFSLQSEQLNFLDPVQPVEGPEVSAPAPEGFAPSRKTEGGPDARRAWEEMRLADPATGRIPADIHRLEREFAASLPSLSRSAILRAEGNEGQIGEWGYRGPWNIGGRTRALAIDVSDSNYQTLLAGGISGGMWRTVNDGGAWTLTTGSSQLHSVTSVAQDTRAGHQDVWYYGTGEVKGNSASSGGGSSYRGDGLFKSTDGGQSWALLPSTSGTPGSSFTNNWQFVWRVAVDPSNATQSEVYAAIYGNIMRSTDGGTTWTVVLGETLPRSRYTDVVVSSTGVVYASLNSLGGEPGIFRSPDGVTWTEITPPGLTDYRRIVLGLAPSNENIVYCVVASVNNDPVNGLYKYTYLTGNGSGAGGSWEDRTAQMQTLPGPDGDVRLQTYTSYCMNVAVHPDDPETIFVGGVSLYRSTDGFATNNNDARVGGLYYTNHHGDQHYMVFHPTNSAIAYTGSDGGVHKTVNVLAESVAWSTLNNGYNTSQFYTAAIDENLPGSDVVIGGMQDNGSWFTNSLTSTSWWTFLAGGDGSYCAVADASGVEGTYVLSVQNGAVYRKTVNNSTGVSINWTRLDPTGAGNYLFINPFIVDPNDTKMLYVGTSNGIWRNSDFTEIPLWSLESTLINWDHLTTVPSESYVTALAMSRSVGRVLYFGTADGQVYRINNADTAPAGTIPTQLDMGTSWSSGSYVAGIAIHPNDDQRVLLGVSNYNVINLFWTEDSGATWTPVEGNLGGANSPSVRDVAIVPFGGVDIFLAATSTGLYSTSDLVGPSTLWSLEAPDLIGNVVVDQLATRPADGLVVAATHGKGVYSIDIPVGTSVDEPVIPRVAQLGQNIPNPFNPMTTIKFNLTAEGRATLVVYNVAGRRVRTLVDGMMSQGDHQVTWNGADDGGRPVASGVYLYRLESGAYHEVKRMTLVR